MRDHLKPIEKVQEQPKAPIIVKVPESVILECQRRVYQLMGEAAAKNKLVTEAAEQFKKLANDADYAETCVWEMIDFLVEHTHDNQPDRDEYRSDLMAAAAERLDLFKKAKTALVTP